MAKDASAKAASVTASARARPRQWSSLSARALAMQPRNSGMISRDWSLLQQAAMMEDRAMKTRRL